MRSGEEREVQVVTFHQVTRRVTHTQLVPNKSQVTKSNTLTRKITTIIVVDGVKAVVGEVGALFHPSFSPLRPGTCHA